MNPRVARRDDAFLWVVDIQEPLLRVMSHPDRLLANAGLLIEAAKVLGLPLLVTEQYPERFGPTVESLRCRWDGVEPLGKMAFSGFGAEGMRERIRETGRRTAILCGVETHVCVQTAHDLLAEGFAVHIPADAVDSRAEINWRLGVEKMRDSGAIITSTEMVVYEMLGKAATPEFKALLPLIR